MRIALVIPTLEAGGAEKVMSTMANHFARSGWAVNLVTWDDGRKPPFFPLDASVGRTAIDLLRPARSTLDAFRGNLARIVRMREVIRETAPSVVVSFLNQTNIISILATLGMGIPVVVAERNDPERYPLTRPWSMLRRIAYGRSASVVVQTAAAARYYQTRLNTQVAIIPNPVIVDDVCCGELVDVASPRVVAMGRFKEAKNFPLLLRAFAKATSDRPRWNLAIVGDGPLRGDLERQALDLGIGSRVSFTGFLSKPHRFLAASDIFVLSSDLEGFPCVLVEAMGCGLPVIATRYHDGVEEIIQNRDNGIIVDRGDEEALAGALGALMDDPSFRDRLGRRARQVLCRYDVDGTMAKWDELLAGLVSPAKSGRYGKRSSTPESLRE